jgi:Cysteine rich repeat
MSLLRLTLIALLFATPFSAVFAQGTPQQRAACRPDVVKFCKGLGDDPGVILDCLEKNKDKISEKCQKVIAAK